MADKDLTGRERLKIRLDFARKSRDMSAEEIGANFCDRDISIGLADQPEKKAQAREARGRYIARTYGWP